MVKRKYISTAAAWVTCFTAAGGLLMCGGQALTAGPAPRAGATAPVQDPATNVGVDRGIYSPPVRFADKDTNLYWGNTHLHTSNSFDAYGLGNTGVGPEQAYRFAIGQEVVSSTGQRAKLRRPLDFLVITDHAEYMGVISGLAHSEEAPAGWEGGRRWKDMLKAGELRKLLFEMFHALWFGTAPTTVPEQVKQSVWRKVAETADRFNAPGRFTAMIGYEWSSTPSGDNLHRNVLFRDGADKAGQIVPLSSLDSNDPEKLWAFFAEYEARTGGQILAIPHNGNLSNGRMFSPESFTGQPLTAAYARERSRWEPAVEVTQVKGTSEAHPSLSPTDEFANFELWDKANITSSTPKQPWMLRYEYARSALQEGLRHQQKLGANPFKFGMVGGTDMHNALTSTTEDNFFGEMPDSEPSASRFSQQVAEMKNGPKGWQKGASGLTGVWARENTREAIFDAIKRREVYATTGSRIQLRFFGGWAFAKADVSRPDYARLGYDKGVPMGGDLARASVARSPSFMIVAAKDPDEANLDRIQVIKGWVDTNGQTHEKIYDVALSGGRKVNPRTGKAPPVGNTVDLADATYTNSIGAPELSALWVDPDFNAAQRAFYYVRVLEIPKPRWTAYDAAFFKTRAPVGVPMTVQDRAYSSPIWYNP